VITQKEDYFIISTVYGCNEDSKFIQICGYQYNDKNTTNYNFFLTDYINATRLYSSQFGVYFGNNNTGDLFIIKKQEDPILDRSGISISKPIASIISGLTGYEKGKTSHLLTKNITSFNSSGTFEDKTEIQTIINDYKSDICILNLSLIHI
jgi:hypothetical protein